MLRRLLLSVGLLAVLVGPAARASAEPGEKSGTTAGLLGGIVGFGSGYYYAGNTTKGVIFTIADLGLRTGYLIGAADENDGLVIGTGLGILASALYQGLDGVAEAKRQNQKRGLGLLAWESPLGLEFGMATMPSWDSGRLESLWSAGGVDRERALAASMMRQSRPPLSLSLGLGNDTSVGLGWSSNF